MYVLSIRDHLFINRIVQPRLRNISGGNTCQQINNGDELFLVRFVNDYPAAYKNISGGRTCLQIYNGDELFLVRFVNDYPASYKTLVEAVHVY